MRFSSQLRRLKRVNTRYFAAALLLATVTLVNSALADDLGVIGPVYPIAEHDLLAFIQAKLRAKADSGALETLMREAARRATDGIENPPSAKLSKATAPRTYYFDPAVVLPDAVRDADGKILVAAGTTVNPLERVSLSKRLIFFDARDAAQVKIAHEFIEREGTKVKPVVTGGSFMQLMRRWKQRVYFDQQGTLTKQLQIHAVPALVSQDGKRLRIDELP
jgi:conjugal transfer pilus assembly protein TraW